MNMNMNGVRGRRGACLTFPSQFYALRSELRGLLESDEGLGLDDVMHLCSASVQILLIMTDIRSHQNLVGGWKIPRVTVCFLTFCYHLRTITCFYL